MASDHAVHVTRPKPGDDMTLVLVAPESSPAVNTFDNFERVAVYAEVSTGPRTFTFIATNTCDRDALHDASVVIPAAFSGIVAFGFPFDRYGSRVQFTVDDASGVTMVPVRVG